MDSRCSADDRADETDFDVIVLGCGISGMVSASVLLDQGSSRVLVVDEYPQPGGNHIDRSHGDYTFDIGSLIFQDDSPLLQHFPELLPRYVPIDPNWARMNPQGQVTLYPFSVRDDLISAGPVEIVRILMSAVASRLFRRRMENARDFARYWIGDRLLNRSGLANYMERFCGLPADRIDLEFARKRMMWIAEYASVPNLARRLLTSVVRPEKLVATNTQLARPREGFAYLYQPAVERLSLRGVTFLLGTRPTALRRTDGTFSLTVGGRSHTAARVVSTIPIDHALELCGLGTDQRLPTVTLISLFFSFSGERGFAEPVLYNFAHDGAWKRLTVHSDFYGRVEGREYFGVEVIADRVGCDVAAAERDFRDHVVANGLFSGDLWLEGSNVLPNAYPIYTEGAADRAHATITALKEWGLESLGRQGGFRYQPTARASTVEAEAILRTR